MSSFAFYLWLLMVGAALCRPNSGDEATTSTEKAPALEAAAAPASSEQASAAAAAVAEANGEVSKKQTWDFLSGLADILVPVSRGQFVGSSSVASGIIKVFGSDLEHIGTTQSPKDDDKQYDDSDESD